MRKPGALVFVAVTLAAGVAQADDLILRHRMVVADPPSTETSAPGETRAPRCRTTTTFAENPALRESTTVTHRHCE